MTLPKIPAIVWLLGSVAAFALGEMLSKKVVTAPSVPLFLWMMLAYALGVLLWLPALSLRGNLITTGILWSMVSMFVTVGIGVLYYGEKMTAKNAIGVLLALLAIYMSH